LSHKKTLEIQIPKYDLIFPNKKIFNNCTFITYKPVQQNGGCCDGQSWHVHIENMKNDIAKI